MILVIDTSSVLCALAVLDPDRRQQYQHVFESHQMHLPERFRDMVKGGGALTKVAVATGPGSFTGLRVGVSFGLGLAMGLQIPLVPLPTLPLQAARSVVPVLAVSEAGRGRVYYLPPGGQASIGEPADLPREHDVVGWLKPQTERSLVEAGLRFKPKNELRNYYDAAKTILETAREVPYGSLEIEYMQSFSAKR